MNNRFSSLASMALVLGLPGCLGDQRAQFSVYHDRASFEAASGRLTEIDFENLPSDASVDNSLVIAGVRFGDPYGLQIK